MDYRKDMRTPKDRVDDELLAQLLRETDELLEGCGCEGGNDRSAYSRGARRNRSNGRVSCGCDRNRIEHRMNEHRAEERIDKSCGCGRNREENTGRCGCRRERYADGSDNPRSCADSRYDARNNNCCEADNDNRCGCGNLDGCARSEKSRDCINHRSLSIQTQGLPLVMSYAPDHEYHELYEDEEALVMGTLFRELNFPFYQSNCRGGCSEKKDKACGCGE